MEEKLGNKEQEKTEQSNNELLEETEQENELRPRSSIRRNKERYEEKQHRFPKITRRETQDQPRAYDLPGSGCVVSYVN